MRHSKIILASALVLATAAPLHAQKSRADNQRGQPSFATEQNSAFCGTTFFTNGDDSLDFRGGMTRKCFDMKGGDDLLILNREAFPAGIELSSGTGRDTVWATDGPDTIVDPDGRDKEIRTYDGDDRIELRVRVDKDPFRGVEISDRTEVSPGRGTNRVRLGGELYTNAFAREGFNVRLNVSGESRNRIEGVCGRPNERSVYDLRTADIPESATISTETFGCGIGLFGIHGDVDIAQAGGRLALQTSSAGFRVSRGENVPRITGSVTGGAAFLLDIDQAHAGSDLTWEGTGSASIRSRVEGVDQGGRFAVRSAADGYYDGYVNASSLDIDMAARGRIDVTLQGRAEATDQQLTLAAPRMDIRWTYHGGQAFPKIRNADPVSYEAEIYTQPRIDFDAGERVPRPDEGSETISDPDRLVNPDLPAEISDMEPEFRTIEVTPGAARLSLVIRRQNDPWGTCVRVTVIDAEGDLPVREETCPDRASPVRSMVMRDVSGYEEIRIEGDIDMRLPINGTSGFNVGDLDIQL